MTELRFTVNPVHTGRNSLTLIGYSIQDRETGERARYTQERYDSEAEAQEVADAMNHEGTWIGDVHRNRIDGADDVITVVEERKMQCGCTKLTEQHERTNHPLWWGTRIVPDPRSHRRDHLGR